MKILNPLKPPTKRASKPKEKKKNKAEQFVSDLEDKMFTQGEAEFGQPLDPTAPQMEVMNAKTFGLSNISVRRKVREYLPQVEQLKTLLHQGRSLSQAMEECKIPNTLETRKAIGKALELDAIIEFRSSPELERMLVQSVRMKFLREATLKGDSKEAFKWATLIQGDAEVFKQKQELPAIYMNKEHLAHFLDNATTEEAIEADFELILDEASKGESNDEEG